MGVLALLNVVPLPTTQLLWGFRKHLLAAICIAPSILANAGLLEGKKVTSYSSEASNIKSKGANYTSRPVEQDGKIITADGPGSAKAFGKAIAEAL